MSIHSSLRISGALRGTRSVFTRVERLQILTENARWSQEQSVYGLPKVRTKFKSVGGKKKKKDEKAEGEGASTEAAAPATTKAPGGKAPAGKGAPGKGAPGKTAPGKTATGKGAAGKK
jgi:small basic protein (TIGR04137 family)